MSETAPYFPDCPACGHNVSAVLAGRCTAFVPYPDGDPRGLAGYCYCRCVNDPAVRAWMDGTPVPGSDEEEGSGDE